MHLHHTVARDTSRLLLQRWPVKNQTPRLDPSHIITIVFVCAPVLLGRRPHSDGRVFLSFSAFGCCSLFSAAFFAIYRRPSLGSRSCVGAFARSCVVLLCLPSRLHGEEMQRTREGCVTAAHPTSPRALCRIAGVVWGVARSVRLERNTLTVSSSFSLLVRFQMARCCHQDSGSQQQ